PNDMTTGGFGQLPRSVQSVLSSKGMSEAAAVDKITDLVKSGNPSLRQGTELDRNMLNKATEMMSSPTFEGTPLGSGKGGGPVSITGSGMQTANDVLATAGQDHQAVHDILRDGTYSDRFMHGALTTDWSDGG